MCVIEGKGDVSPDGEHMDNNIFLFGSHGFSSFRNVLRVIHVEVHAVYYRMAYAVTTTAIIIIIHA